MYDLGLPSICIVTAILLSASYQDIRCREVSDLHWAIIGIVGVIMVFIDLQGVYRITATIGSAMILFGILCPFDLPKVVWVLYDIITVGLFLIPAISSPEYMVGSLCIIVPTIVFYAMYALGILRGGADTKCMIVMSIAFHGDVSSYAITGTSVSPLPFPFIVLFYAALMTSAYALTIMSHNVFARNGIGFRPWYRVSIAEARGSYVWPKQDVIDGDIVTIKGVSDGSAYDRLEDVGAKDVLVTPMIPFIVPITVAFVFVSILGDPLSTILSSLC